MSRRILGAEREEGWMGKLPTVRERDKKTLLGAVPVFSRPKSIHLTVFTKCMLQKPGMYVDLIGDSDIGS